MIAPMSTRQFRSCVAVETLDVGRAKQGEVCSGPADAGCPIGPTPGRSGPRGSRSDSPYEQVRFRGLAFGSNCLVQIEEAGWLVKVTYIYIQY